MTCWLLGHSWIYLMTGRHDATNAPQTIRELTPSEIERRALHLALHPPGDIRALR